MDTYTNLDVKTAICSKDYGGFMSQKLVQKIVDKIVSRMQQKVDMITKVSQTKH